jgi:uncharacterized BrkB/YihY/UPF0761 family membrane protein
MGETWLDKLPQPWPTIVAVLCLALIVIFYFLPGVIASRRDSRSAGAITFLNAIIGWTGIGWVICFIWACVDCHKYES